MGKAIKERLRWLSDEFGKANLWLYATSGAYYLFFSLVPLAVIFLALMPYLPIMPADELLETLTLYAPEEFQQLMEQIVSDLYAGSAMALGVGLVIELWSAGQFFALLMRGVGHIYDGGYRGGYLRRRLMGVLYTVILVALVLGNLVLLFLEERLVTEVIPEGTAFWASLLQARWIVFMAAVTIINALLFRYVPRRELKFWRQLPGAIFSAGVWLAFSRGYSWAVDRFRFFSIYGGLAIVIISLFWMFCSLYILFLGAWLNALPGHWRDECQRQAESQPREEPPQPEEPLRQENIVKP